MTSTRLAIALVLAAATASAAALETFQGYDQGLGNQLRLPSHLESDAARDAFLARLAPGLAAQTFESVAVTPPVYEIRSLTLAFERQTATLHGSGLVMDSPAGTANPINGVPSGVYPISGTRAWLGADDFELVFDAPQVGLGF